jgi:hypothetical protein
MVIATQWIFTGGFSLAYLISPNFCHRSVFNLLSDKYQFRTAFMFCSNVVSELHSFYYDIFSRNSGALGVKLCWCTKSPIWLVDPDQSSKIVLFFMLCQWILRWFRFVTNQKHLRSCYSDLACFLGVNRSCIKMVKVSTQKSFEVVCSCIPSW